MTQMPWRWREKAEIQAAKPFWQDCTESGEALMGEWPLTSLESALQRLPWRWDHTPKIALLSRPLSRTRGRQAP